MSSPKNYIRKGYGLMIICFALLLSANSGCKKTPENVYVGAELNSWFNYKAYSYWVMKDVATGELDSIRCNGQNSRTFTGDNKHQYESKSIGFSEFRPNAITYNSGFAISMNASAEKDHSELFFFYTGTAGINYDPFLNIPYESNGYSLGYGQNGQRDQYLNVSYIATANIDGNSFDSVYHLTYTFPNSASIEHIYINRKIGFIKLMQDNPLIKRTITLQRWNVTHN